MVIEKIIKVEHLFLTKTYITDVYDYVT